MLVVGSNLNQVQPNNVYLPGSECPLWTLRVATPPLEKNSMKRSLRADIEVENAVRAPLEAGSASFTARGHTELTVPP